MDLMLRKADFDKAADEIMARIERDGAIHRSSIVEAMVAVAATVPAVANVVPARGLSAPVVDSEHEAYDKWLRGEWYLASGCEAGGIRRVLPNDLVWHRSVMQCDNTTGYFRTKDLAESALKQTEQRRRSERDN